LERTAVRCFLAIPVGPEPSALLARAQERLRRTGADVKWVERENLHLTLKFLGEVEESRLDAVRGSARDIAAGTPAMAMRYRGIGCFPHERAPRVVWVGTAFAPDAIGTLAARLETELAARGFPTENRPFRGHVTLGRVRSPRGAKDLARELGGLRDGDFGGQAADGFVLFRSDLGPSGPKYSVLETFPFAKGP